MKRTKHQMLVPAFQGKLIFCTIYVDMIRTAVMKINVSEYLYEYKQQVSLFSRLKNGRFQH